MGFLEPPLVLLVVLVLLAMLDPRENSGRTGGGGCSASSLGISRADKDSGAGGMGIGSGSVFSALGSAGDTGEPTLSSKDVPRSKFSGVTTAVPS
eukprot:CAMPEP_0172641134 /NCGR_PEP_ID=MMETSP1068-20121228/225937_1 /TAXON_ID=35684 /ORGANISM="Pseudopedinella elastica, Strain CCMP716" /LENGTH=94 /DNA_ID=CAMNT_0013454647 /DNA_START=68 /DNA_END=349 /DNA_ORIENTATION=+